ncbi:Protein yellow [Blattella germanica]|nr:Protein yellow [Blattella germanica]
MDDNGIMFFNLIDQNAVGCWDSSRHPYHKTYHGLVDRDDVGLVFPSDVKVDRNQNLWVLSDRMPVFLVANALDFNDVNFRIYTTTVANALRGTVCESSQHHLHNFDTHDYVTVLQDPENYNFGH